MAWLLSLVLCSTPPPLDASALPPQAALAAQLLAHPDVRQALGAVEAARADALRSGLLPNPGVDLSANTLPVGVRNPPEAAFSDIPNYAAQLSMLVELGKRGPRQAAARAALQAATFTARETLRQRYWDLVEALSQVAASEVRLEKLRSISSETALLAALQEARAAKGDVAAIDADRARVEAGMVEVSLADEEAHLAEALRSCAAIWGATCLRFDDGAKAGRFLEALPASGAGPAERPDVRALAAQADSARAAETLADRHALPDPTLRAGFVHDQFTVSGNQPNSVFLGLSFPLPVFDHGQADAAQARAQVATAEALRAATLERAAEQLRQAAANDVRLSQERARLVDAVLPLARDVVDRLDKAVQRGGASLPEVLLARRSMLEAALRVVELDLSRFHVATERARLGGGAPPWPPPLADE